MTKPVKKPLKNKTDAPKTTKKVSVKKNVASTKKPVAAKKDDTANNQAQLATNIQKLQNLGEITKKRLLLSTVVLLISLLIVGYSGFYWYQQSVKLAKNSSSNKLLQQLTERLETLETSSKKNNKTITQQLVKMQNNIAELSGINKIKFLIEDAIWLLDIRQKPKQSAQVLRQAVAILSSENNSKNNTEQIILTRAAADLLAMKSPNTLQLTQTLDTLISNIATLKIADNQLKDTAQITHKSGNFLDNVWRDIKNLVKVHRADEQLVGKLLSDEAKSLAPDLLKLQIQYLRLAVLSKNSVEFKNELKQTIELTKNIFDIKDANTLEFINVLQGLQVKIIEMDKIPNSITQVRALLNQ